MYARAPTSFSRRSSATSRVSPCVPSYIKARRVLMFVFYVGNRNAIKGARERHLGARLSSS